MAMSAISVALGLVQAIPLSEGMRTAMLWLACVWGAAACILVGPGWLRYRRLQRDLAAREAELACWTQQQREQARDTSPATMDENPPSGAA